jgi:hypothetical protein
MHSALILPQDFPLRLLPPRKPRPPQKQPQPSPLPHPIFADVFEAHLQTLKATLQPITIAGYRVAARDFLLYLQSHFPQLRQLSELRRDPHLLGWLCSLGQHQPPFAEITRQKYRCKLHALFQQLASHGHLLHDQLLIKDSHHLSHPTFGEIFQTQIQTLATTLRPNTIYGYRCIARRFLLFFQTHFPQLQQLSELRRDPHWLAWLRYLYERSVICMNKIRPCRMPLAWVIS